MTPAVLDAFGQSPGDLRWSIRVANLKPFHYTLNPNDRIEAAVEIEGDVFTRRH